MRKLNLFVLVGLCVALVPGVALAGNGGTGACFVVSLFDIWDGEGALPEGKFELAGCADGFTEQECTSVDELTEFWEGATCEDVAAKGGFDWDGSCVADFDPLGEVCVVLWTEPGGTFTQALCVDDIGGEWSPGVDCGIPVPIMPGFGMAALALLILAGALIILTVRGSLPSA